LRITLTLLILSVLCVGTASALPFAYVANNTEDTVFVINDVNSVIRTVKVGRNPGFVAATSNGRLVFVTNSGEPPQNPGNSVSVIQTSDNTVFETVRFDFHAAPVGVAIADITEEPPMGEGNGSGGDGCGSLAPSTASSASLPLYLLIPAIILIRRLWRRRTNQKHS
jgi:YVTN family beta-propeller protein